MIVKTISIAVLFLRLCFLYLLGNVAVHIPCLKGFIVRQMDRVASIKMPIDNYWSSLFTWPMMKTLWKYGLYEIHKDSKVGKIAPNPRLAFADEGIQQEVRLLDLAKPERPLVVVFGSCTCPVLIAKMDQLHDVQRKFSAVADFVFVYVQEAHPDDGWQMKNNYKIPRHDSVKQRLEAAQSLRPLLPKDIPLYADTIENEASVAYSGCPNRILIIDGNILAYQNAPGPTSFNFDGVRRWLLQLRRPV